MILEKEIIVRCLVCTGRLYRSLKRSMVWLLDGIKNQLTTKYLRSVFIIMLFVCAINPFLVICQYVEKFIISFFLVCFCFRFPSICGGQQTKIQKLYENHRFCCKSFHTTQKPYPSLIAAQFMIRIFEMDSCALYVFPCTRVE